MSPKIPLSSLQSRVSRIPLIRTPWMLVILGMIILIVVMFWQSTQQTPVDQTADAPQLISPEGDNVGLDIAPVEWPTYPQQMSTHQVTASTPLQVGAEALAQKLQLTPFTPDRKAFRSQDRTQTLIVAPQEQGIDYSNRANAPTPEDIVNAETALAHAKVFLTDLGFSEDELQLSQNYLAFDAEHPMEPAIVSRPEGAVALLITAQQLFNGYPLRSEAGSITEFTLTATSKGVTKAIISHFPLVTEPLRPQPTYTQAEILENIRAGEYVVVGNLARVDSKDLLIAVDPVDTEVEYRFSSATNTLAPYLFIRGSGQLQSGRVVQVQITTPLTPVQ